MLNKNHIEKISDILGSNILDSEKFYKKSLVSGEFSNEKESFNWIKNRLENNTVFLTVADYEEVCLNALKSLKNFAGTDFGSTRQRDFNQKWADTTRGYLGERAFQKFLLKKFGMESQLKHTEGELKDFVHTDIYEVKEKGEQKFRKPKKTIGIKTTSLNGMWLDIPGTQFHHSDCHILVQLLLEKNHMFSFFKEISIFKDKLLKRAIEKGWFNKDEAGAFFDNIPNLKQIPAYIAGFILTKNFKSNKYKYKGKKGIKHYTITSWSGRYNRSFLEDIKKQKDIKGDIKFQGINRFSHDSAYIFNTGNLRWKESDWQDFINIV